MKIIKWNIYFLAFIILIEVLGIENLFLQYHVFANDEAIDVMTGHQKDMPLSETLVPLLKSCFDLQEQSFLRNIQRLEKNILLYDNQEKQNLIGFATCDNENGHVHITNVCIDPNQRGKKLGSFIMKNILNRI